jgi:tryptophanyl-tRNA synthetase
MNSINLDTAEKKMQSDFTGKKRVFSGIQPTGKLHMGNYLGAISVWAAHQDDFDSLFCVVDMHAITLPEAVHPAVLREKTLETAGIYLACGIDPDKSTIFVQSHVPQHAELAWILTCITPLGWLQRMTQFKDKARGAKSIGAGLLNYPALMAADILLYDTDLVPVGEDQKQHIELTRDVATRFTSLYRFPLRVPEPMIRKSGARIMALDDPDIKMSKSVGEKVRGHSIGLLDPPEEIRRSIMRAATDSGNEMRFDRASPGVRNLLVLYEMLSGLERNRIEEKYCGKGYSVLKKDLAELADATLRPIRERYQAIIAEPDYLDAILEKGAARAQTLARPMMAAIKKAVGFVPTGAPDARM